MHNPKCPYCLTGRNGTAPVEVRRHNVSHVLCVFCGRELTETQQKKKPRWQLKLRWSKYYCVLWLLIPLLLCCSSSPDIPVYSRVPVDSFQTATATWYARPGSRWWNRIPALGLRDGTSRRIRDYARSEWCVAVPMRDTASFPLGSRVWIAGKRGTVIARVVDVNTDTTWDLVG
ncbi:hypothetical protein, partial [Thermogutta sp.]|uniref:hypothetical protein n=1 Tax=Thermogutta sp. TaxID=1962930 RepID=UPI00322095B9